jgi:hypothetical protein
MVDPRRLVRALTEAAAGDPAASVEQICEIAVRMVPVTGAAVSVMSDVNTREIVYSSDDVATELEELQFGLGEGPCVAAFHTGRPVLVADLHSPSDPRWPMFTAAAAQTTARAVYAFPLRAGVIGVGVLDLYRIRPGLLDDTALAAALSVTDAALWSLLSLRALTSTVRPGATPTAPDGSDTDGQGGRGGWPAMTTGDHRVVYQASGMVMVQAGISAEDALDRLRAYAFTHDQTLRAVAAQVVARRLRFDAGD